jgi:hypothetical protein
MHTPVEIAVGIAVHSGRGFAADCFSSEQLGRTLEHVRERQRVVHHQALHTVLLLYDGGMRLFNRIARDGNKRARGLTLPNLV